MLTTKKHLAIIRLPFILVYIFFSAPDDSTIFVVLPGQKYLLQRRGWEAALLTGAGGLGGIAVLTLLTPFAPNLLSSLRAILQPHLHWVLAAVTLFMPAEATDTPRKILPAPITMAT